MEKLSRTVGERLKSAVAMLVTAAKIRAEKSLSPNRK